MSVAETSDGNSFGVPDLPFTSFLSSSRESGWRKESIVQSTNSTSAASKSIDFSSRASSKNLTLETVDDDEEEEEEDDENIPSLLDPVRKRWKSPILEPTLLKTIFGIGPRTHYMPASRMIYPYSPFGVFWTVMTGIFLLYTAIVTPAVISFHWLDEDCVTVPTMYFDCVVDSFFLLDIVFCFCVGVVHQGQYYEDWWWVTKRYLTTGSFFFDICTSIPVSFVELSISFACANADGDNSRVSIDSTQLRFIRAMKPLRWFKLARIIKLNQSANVRIASVWNSFVCVVGGWGNAWLPFETFRGIMRSL